MRSDSLGARADAKVGGAEVDAPLLGFARDIADFRNPDMASRVGAKVGEVDAPLLGFARDIADFRNPDMASRVGAKVGGAEAGGARLSCDTADPAKSD